MPESEIHFWGNPDRAACGLLLEGRDWSISWRSVSCRQCIRWGWAGINVDALQRRLWK